MRSEVSKQIMMEWCPGEGAGQLLTTGGGWSHRPAGGKEMARLVDMRRFPTPSCCS